MTERRKNIHVTEEEKEKERENKRRGVKKISQASVARKRQTQQARTQKKNFTQVWQDTGGSEERENLKRMHSTNFEMRRRNEELTLMHKKNSRKGGVKVTPHFSLKHPIGKREWEREKERENTRTRKERC